VTTTPSGDPTLAYLWQFGDGNTGAWSAPSHRYFKPGTYTVSLQVSNAAGSDTETKPEYIVILEGYVLYLPITVVGH
jgi:PKD repeat protein